MKLYFLIFLIFLTVNTCISENYAVLISGNLDEDETPLQKTYMADFDNWPEFWHDEFLMWETLYNLGFKDENIFVFFEDGDDASVESERYDYPLGINSIVDYDANKTTILNFLDGLQFELTENDFLFIWTMGHGYEDNNHAYLIVRDGSISDTELSIINYIPFDKRVIWMQQCRSGGFIDDLDGSNTIIITACQPDEDAYRADDVDPDGTDSYENEIWQSQAYEHGEFNYHGLNAVNLETIVYNSLSQPDQNSDGKTSIQEIYDWADSTESSKIRHTIGLNVFGPQHPQIDDDGNNAGSVFNDVDPPEITISGSVVSSHPKISWSRPSGVQDIDKYEVWRYRTVSGGGYTLRSTVTGTTYTDNGIFVGKIPPFNKVYYKVKVVDKADNKSGYSNVVNFWDNSTSKPISMRNENSIPKEFTLEQNYPNPFNPNTKINFGLPKESKVELIVFNLGGQTLTTLVNEQLEAGRYSADFDATDYPSGVYFYRLSTESFTDVKRMLLVK